MTFRVNQQINQINIYVFLIKQRLCIKIVMMVGCLTIRLLEYPIPCPAAQKPSSADISETESGIIDPLVSKLPEKILNVCIRQDH